MKLEGSSVKSLDVDQFVGLSGGANTLFESVFSAGPGAAGQPHGAFSGKESLAIGNISPVAQVLSGHLPTETLDRLTAKLHRTVNEIETARSEVELHHGTSPTDAVIRSMETHRVVGLGESHFGHNPHRAFGAAVMEKLHAAGATHLAIEAPDSDQPVIDAWMKTGHLERKQLPDILQFDDYSNLLESAKHAGLTVVCADNRESGENARDGFMAKNISKVLDADPKNKVAFWVGNLHLDRSNDPDEDEDTGHGEKIIPAAALLRQKYSVETFLSDAQQSSELGRCLPDLTVPVVFSTRETPHAAQLREIIGYDNMIKDWDNMIVYPVK